MITKEVREWLQKVERKQYVYEDAIYELSCFAPYLTREELCYIKIKLENSYQKT